MAGIEVVSGVSDEAYPEIFDIRAMLPQSDVKKPGQLTDDQLKHYFEEGYVVLNDFFTKEELEPCRKTTEDLVDDLAKRLHKAGKISDLYEGYGLFERLTKLEEEFPGANVVLHKIASMPEREMPELLERYLQRLKEYKAFHQNDRSNSESQHNGSNPNNEPETIEPPH